MSNKELIGIWRTDPNHELTQQLYGAVTMNFMKNGELVYTIEQEDKEQKILMTYEIIGNKIITDQNSSHYKESTEFRIKNGKLEFTFEGYKTIYVKED
jgi:hypothetical protein